MNLNPFNTEPKPDGAKVFSSKAGIAANKVHIKWTADNPDTELTEDSARDMLAKKKSFLIGGITIDEVVAELKKENIIKPPAPVVKEKPVSVVKEVILHETQFRKLDGLKTIEDDDLKKRLEENRFFDAVEKDIFKNDAELEVIYQRSLTLGKENSSEEETDEYYNEFADIVKGGKDAIKEDLYGPKGLKARQQEFKAKMAAMEGPEAIRAEKSKKIATIIERSVTYGANMGWYGNSVTIEPTSQFDDVKRGVDEVLEIRKESSIAVSTSQFDDVKRGVDEVLETRKEVESSFLALGIDVTYRGLLSEQYKQKLFGILRGISKGHKTKIKYFKNHKGEKMKEFAVPKTILYFNINDVKDFATMIKHIDEPGIMESFKNTPQKFAIMNQMIIQCEKLAAFAEESKNDIFKKYKDIVSSIKELSLKNPDLKKILDARHEDDVSTHMDYLIAEFKILQKEEEKHPTYIETDLGTDIEDVA